MEQGRGVSGVVTSEMGSHGAPGYEVGETRAIGNPFHVSYALEGKAHSAQELGLLCETYVALGDQAHAREAMNEYVSRFPDAPRSAHYRNALEHGR